MKIAINSYFLGKPAQGFGRYTKNLLDNIKEFGNPKDYFLLYPGQLPEVVRQEYAGFNFLESEEKEHYLWAGDLPKLFDLSAFDLLYIPYNTPPLGKIDIPFVVTIHDSIPGVPFSRTALRHPSLLSMLNIGEYSRMKKELQASDNASRITTVSQSAKADILKRMKYPAEKIDVVYNTVDRDFKPTSENEITAVKKKYGIEKEYLFYLGGIRARKNVAGVINAYSVLSPSLREKYSLVIAGTLNGGLKNLVRRKKLEAQVIEAGMIPQEDIPAVYSGAKLFLFLSFYEGFGLPPIESAACGVPSLVSNMSSLPEVTSGFARLVSPFCIKKAAVELELLLTDEKLYQSLKDRCGVVHERFSRKKIHQQLMDVFHNAVRR